MTYVAFRWEFTRATTRKSRLVLKILRLMPVKFALVFAFRSSPQTLMTGALQEQLQVFERPSLEIARNRNCPPDRQNGFGFKQK